MFWIVGSEEPDPCTTSGLIKDRGFQERLELSFAKTLRNLTKILLKEKICLLQLTDAYRPPTSLTIDTSTAEGSTSDGLRAPCRWSYDYPPYFDNSGLYTNQCIGMCEAVLGTGARCRSV
ncbi:hypothetical protein BJ875DRAFT_235909 [Amylocarpus encephaloides]|uniref:Uncharacterized protein n=1 Tax=Amylocarpus encephaloides TaxID=45428 RepID=A0A9P8C8N6_9HELO|nr:hypothetical protein BJ875DRAFT_235909 [Amylocarpus encephaloides]